MRLVEEYMITWEEVDELRKGWPPRYPRGDPRNYARRSYGGRFGAALKQYKREHGRPWQEDKPVQRPMIKGGDSNGRDKELVELA